VNLLAETKASAQALGVVLLAAKGALGSGSRLATTCGIALAH